MKLIIGARHAPARGIDVERLEHDARPAPATRRSRSRSKTATWRRGSSEVERGRPAPGQRGRACRSPRAPRSTPVTPSSARGRIARGGVARAASSVLARRARVTAGPAAPSAGAAGRGRARRGSQVTTLRAPRSRAMARDHVRAPRPGPRRGGTRRRRARTPRGSARAPRASARPAARRTVSAASPDRRGAARCGAAKRPGVLRHLARGSARGTRRGWSRLARSSFQRSWKVRAATGGRSRVRVHLPKKSGRPREPAVPDERPLEPRGRPARASRKSAGRQEQRAGAPEDHPLASTARSSPGRAARAARPACAGCRCAPGRRPCTRRRARRRGPAPSPTPSPLSIAVRRMPMGPGYV